MKKTIKKPKILILTQINPVNVAYVYDEILASFGLHNEIFSPQIMALLGELSLKESPDDLTHCYRVLNAAFVKNINAAIQRMNPLKPWIFVGNCDKKVKFDHVIGFDGGEDFGNNEIFDYYIDQDQKDLKDAIKIDYYTKNDCDFFFPTIKHLKLFLGTLGITEEREDNGSTT